MRVLVDENLPGRFFSELLGEFETRTVNDLGWSGIKNGELLKRVEGAFDVFVTADKNIRYQQSLSDRSFAIVEIFTNRLPMLREWSEAIREGVGSMSQIAIEKCPSCGGTLERGFTAKAAGLSFISLASRMAANSENNSPHSAGEHAAIPGRSLSIMNTDARPFRRYVLLGVASMASAEFQVNVLLRGNLINFVLAMVVVYAPLSALAYCIGRQVRSKRADLWFYAAGGLFGMLVIEWIFLGFYPGSGKAGIHVAMFTNWAAVFTIPRLFTAQHDERASSARRKIKSTVVVYSVGAPLLVLASPISKGGTVALLMAAYSIRLSFQFVPFLVESSRERTRFNWFNIFLVLAAVINVVLW